MPELSKLIGKKFSEVDNEWQWTYSINFNFIFNEQKITEITITDYTWKKKGRETITKELIIELVKLLPMEKLEIGKRYDEWVYYSQEPIFYHNNHIKIINIC